MASQRSSPCCRSPFNLTPSLVLNTISSPRIPHAHSWVSIGLKSDSCQCQSDTVRIEMDPFVRRFRPKLWAYKVAAAEYEKRQLAADEAFGQEEAEIHERFRGATQQDLDKCVCVVSSRVKAGQSCLGGWLPSFAALRYPHSPSCSNVLGNSQANPGWEDLACPRGRCPAGEGRCSLQSYRGPG